MPKDESVGEAGTQDGTKGGGEVETQSGTKDVTTPGPAPDAPTRSTDDRPTAITRPNDGFEPDSPAADKPDSPAADKPKPPPEEPKVIAKPVNDGHIGIMLEMPWYKTTFPFSLYFYEPFVTLWDYHGLKPDEITVERGRLVHVHNERYMSGRRWRWAWIEDCESGKEGYIPSAYLIPQKETRRETYRGTWYMGNERVDEVRAHMEKSDQEISEDNNMSGGDEYAILVRVRSVHSSGDEGGGPGVDRTVNSEDVQTANLHKPLGTTVGVYQVHRDSHLRYFVNPGNPSPNLYSLISNLKMHPITIPVRLTQALPLRPGEKERRVKIPSPPPHPTRVPLDIGPNIDMMTNDEKRELLRPFGIKSSDITEGIQLGSGNFGQVMKGTWRRSKQKDELEVALKRLTKKEKEQEKGFREEALIMAKLDHPNVISFFGYDDAKHTLVMEMLTCGALKSFLDHRKKAEQDPLPPRQLLDILYQVACGMAHVESQHFIHRDLAARNCMLGKAEGETRRVIKICDFGLAVPMSGDQKRKKTKEEMEAFWAAGCPDYPWRWMALESLKHKQFSHKSDVWAYGVLIEEVCTLGGDPYGAACPQDPLEFIQMLESGTRFMPPVEDSMPPDIMDVQERCMLSDADKRPFFSDIQRQLHNLLLHSEFFSRNIDIHVAKVSLPSTHDNRELVGLGGGRAGGRRPALRLQGLRVRQRPGDRARALSPSPSPLSASRASIFIPHRIVLFISR